jgi:hypothetical protein
MLTKEQCLEKALDMELKADLYGESKATYLRMAAHWHRLAVVAEQKQDAIQTQDGAI